MGSRVALGALLHGGSRWAAAALLAPGSLLDGGRRLALGCVCAGVSGLAAPAPGARLPRPPVPLLPGRSWSALIFLSGTSGPAAALFLTGSPRPRLASLSSWSSPWVVTFLLAVGSGLAASHMCGCDPPGTTSCPTSISLPAVTSHPALGPLVTATS